jgi:hypothetical protein
MRDSRAARLPVWARAFLKHSYLVALLRDRVLRDAEPARTDHGDAAVPGSHAKADARFLTALDLLTREAGDRLIGFYFVRVRDEKDEPPAERLVRQYASQRGMQVFANPADFDVHDYFTLDTHWNAAGHAKAARFLYREIKPALARMRQ